MHLSSLAGAGDGLVRRPPTPKVPAAPLGPDPKKQKLSGKGLDYIAELEAKANNKELARRKREEGGKGGKGTVASKRSKGEEARMGGRESKKGRGEKEAEEIEGEEELSDGGDSGSQ